MSAGIVKLTDRFVETMIDEETVVMDLDKAEFFSLNETAGAVWRAIDGTRDREAVIAAVAAEYAVSPEAIHGEVGDLIDRMRDAGFLALG